MNKIYIDCGTHLGEGLKKHIADHNIDESWKIFTFEANTNTYNLLQSIRANDKLPEQYKWLKWNNITYSNKAVWIKDDEMSFYCSEVANRDQLNNDQSYVDFIKFHDELVKNGELVTAHQRNDYPIDGSSTIMPDHFKSNLSNIGNSLQKSLVWDNKITVPCFDFSTWLKNNVKQEDYVLCKIDIEGAEFEVLKKCIMDDTLKLINQIDIEFHHFGNPLYIQDYNFILQEIYKLNIKFNVW
jgi:FkbM family methyltransferase